jgi:phospholipid/cholesterol/gamma-HCH transport system substrate-binding protein
MASMPSARSIGVGAFVLGGVLLFSLALFFIGNRRMLFSDGFVAYAEFKGISGIQAGSPVRVAGMDAGEVKAVEVPADPSRPFRLRLQVRANLHGLVRCDSVATIQTQGLVGAQFVNIGAGSAASPRIEDGGRVLSREPFELSDLMLQMSDTVTEANRTIAVLRDNIEQAIGAVQQTASDADDLIQGISGNATRISRSSAVILGDLQHLLTTVREGRGTVGRLFADDRLYRDLASTVADARQTVASVRQVAEQANAALKDAGGKEGRLAGLASSMDDTLGKARESMANLADATEALKHNFLLRGYFNRRGYFTLADLSPLEYRRGALASNGRRALRVWLSNAVLFARGGDGQETLTDEGRRRVDSAMGEFLKYRDTGPLIVEGYAQEGDAPGRYLVSRNRASAVRAYLLERFQLDASATGLIALGREGPAQLPDRRWEGIGLALYVQPDALEREE